MKICILHYHYRTGGVTSVVRNAARSLIARGHQVCVVSGEASAEETFDAAVSVLTVPGLGYTDCLMTSVEIEAIEGEALSKVHRVFGEDPDVWHIHNHSLGKGPVLPHLVSVLAQRKQPMVLQIHDFAEDGRPANYRRLCEWSLVEKLYPQNGNIVYALLNGRDRQFLENACFQKTILLPNAIDCSQLRSIAAERTDVWVYPTRAIRRKNIGEFILHAVLSNDGSAFAVTRAPRNPEQWGFYSDWVKYVAAKNVSVLFDYGASCGKSFEELLATSRGALTTSVGEGFGLAYLEPWLFGTSLCGRDLPEITKDFKQDGLNLQHLYSRLDVPVAWLGEDVVRSHIDAGIQSYYAAYHTLLGDSDRNEAYDAAVVAGKIDYGRLDEHMQRLVMDRLLRDPCCRSEICGDLLPGSTDAETVMANRKTIQQTYDLAQYGERLETIYTETLDAEEGDASLVSARDLLSQFMDPKRYVLLRS